MTTEQKLQLIQNLYTALQAESTFFYGAGKQLDQIIKIKSQQTTKTASQLTQQLQLETPDAVFTALSDLFQCAQWEISGSKADSFTATASNCKLCAMCKKIGAPSPCQIYCLNPMKALVQNIKPDTTFTVEATLWNDSECRVVVS